MRRFLGKEVSFLLAASIVVGFVLSGVEVAFAVLIQSFLVSMGTIDASVAKIPAWAPRTFLANLELMVAFAFVRGFVQWYKVYSHAMVNESFAHHMRSLIARWALLSKGSGSGAVFTLLGERVQSGANWITGLQNGFIHVLSLTLILAYLLRAAPSVAIVGIGTLVAFGLALRFLDRHVKTAGNALSEHSSRINDRMLDALKNLQFLKVCRAERRELAKIQDSLDQFYSNIQKFSAIKSWKYAAPQFIGVLVIVLISSYNRRLNLLSGGAFLSFLYLFVRASQILADLSTSVATLRLYHPQFQALRAWWQEAKPEAISGQNPPATSEPTPPVDTALDPTSWNLEGVRFAYNEGSAILDQVSLQTTPGKITVITGASGAGKTTLLHLMGGTLSPREGRVGLNDRYSTFDEALAKSAVRFGYVGPDPHVIQGTVRENLLYGLDYHPSDPEIKSALEKAHCLEFLTDLPRDLERLISDRGEGLSAGQKQRLSLARALLRKPTALLLDEPTANLDEASASVVVEALGGLRGKMSIVIVTHHKPLLKIADQVVEF